MSAEINPRKLHGPWKDGYALDFHTLSSVFIGHDAYGRAQFDTKRSPVGELLYRLKYGNDRKAIPELIEAIMEFWASWKPSVDAVIPAPPSNLGRRNQPVIAIATGLAEALHVPVYTEALSKAKNTPELKNVFGYDERVEALEGVFSVSAEKTAGKGILLFDDLYRSGATAGTIAQVLNSAGKARAVYLLTLTRTRSNF